MTSLSLVPVFRTAPWPISSATTTGDGVQQDGVSTRCLDSTANPSDEKDALRIPMHSATRSRKTSTRRETRASAPRHERPESTPPGVSGRCCRESVCEETGRGGGDGLGVHGRKLLSRGPLQDHVFHAPNQRKCNTKSRGGEGRGGRGGRDTIVNAITRDGLPAGNSFLDERGRRRQETWFHGGRRAMYCLDAQSPAGPIAWQPTARDAVPSRGQNGGRLRLLPPHRCETRLRGPPPFYTTAYAMTSLSRKGARYPTELRLGPPSSRPKREHSAW